jgi:DNA (cytosine-5)-methyltransferase 1
MGYHRAGFDVVGVDIAPQPHYPFEFIQADAIEYLSETMAVGFDAVHASPPCQAYSRMRHLPWVKARVADYWDSIPPTLAALRTIDRPWVVENVTGAPLDGITLCGCMFALAFDDGVPLYRKRLFASSVFMLAPGHGRHTRAIVPGPLLKDRARRINGQHTGRDKLDYIIAGKGRTAGTPALWSGAMGTPWMSIKEMAQAIPPAYTEWIGRQLLASIEVKEGIA